LKLYEGMFLVDNSEARKNYEAVSENISRIITKYGGEVIRSERWSERRLAYPVRRRDRGTYVLVYFLVLQFADSASRATLSARGR